MRLLAAVALLLATAGCKDDENPAALGEPALLSIQNAAADAEVITVESPKKQTLSIRAEAEQISGSYITVVFKTDPELVESYNAAHGTSYKLCPSEAYAFSTTEVMLPRYNTVSSTMKVELFSERMPDEEPYLLLDQGRPAGDGLADGRRPLHPLQQVRQAGNVPVRPFCT